MLPATKFPTAAVACARTATGPTPGFPPTALRITARSAGVEIRRVGLDPRAQNPFLRDVVRHADQHLVSAVQSRLSGGDTRAVLTRNGLSQKQQSKELLHTAPAFIKSCKCTIPTTFLSASSTGRAMMP